MLPSDNILLTHFHDNARSCIAMETYGHIVITQTVACNIKYHAWGSTNCKYVNDDKDDGKARQLECMKQLKITLNYYAIPYFCVYP